MNPMTRHIPGYSIPTIPAIPISVSVTLVIGIVPCPLR
jgi:hypothetical protein